MDYDVLALKNVSKQTRKGKTGLDGTTTPCSGPLGIANGPATNGAPVAGDDEPRRAVPYRPIAGISTH